jgi:hypothetical protein
MSVVSDAALESAKQLNVNPVGGRLDLWTRRLLGLATTLKPSTYAHATVAVNSSVAIRSTDARSFVTRAPADHAGKLFSMNSAATAGALCCNLHCPAVPNHLRVASHASVARPVGILKCRTAATEMRRAVQNARS